MTAATGGGQCHGSRCSRAGAGRHACPEERGGAGGDGGIRQDDRGCGTTGQSPQAPTNGDWPWAAPATAPHCVGLSCTAVAGAGDGPALVQQIICQILPAHLCFQNNNTNLLSATSMLVLGRWWEITGKFRPFKNSQLGAVVLNRSNGVTLNLPPQPGGQCCPPGIWRIVTGIVLQRTGQPRTARNHPIPNVHMVEFKHRCLGMKMRTNAPSLWEEPLKLKVGTSRALATPFLGIHLTGMCTYAHQNTYSRMFIEA